MFSFLIFTSIISPDLLPREDLREGAGHEQLERLPEGGVLRARLGPRGASPGGPRRLPGRQGPPSQVRPPDARVVLVVYIGSLDDRHLLPTDNVNPPAGQFHSVLLSSENLLGPRKLLIP